jgi:NAD(P)-dependent dehydrogenase (short-subunit alcohol dehydrogenase family)
MKSPRKNAVTVITGASQGIGAAIARAFAGARIGPIALVARNARNLERVAASCRKAGVRAEAFRCDVGDADQVAEMAAAVLKKFKRVDVVINNAGQYLGKSFLDYSVAEFDKQLAANLRSVFLVSKSFVPAMVERGRGDVFNMGSIASFEGLEGGTGYCASKFGVLGLSRVMREELKTKGVRVTCVMPGATWSPSWGASDEPVSRFMPDTDIARAFLEVYRMTRRTVVEEIVLRPQLGDF